MTETFDELLLSMKLCKENGLARETMRKRKRWSEAAVNNDAILARCPNTQNSGPRPIIETSKTTNKPYCRKRGRWE